MSVEAFDAVLVDDEAPARALLRDLLSEHSEVRVVGEASSVQEALEVIARERPALVFLDIRLGRGSGFDLLTRLPAPVPRIVFVSAFGQYAVRAFDNDAVDYLLKPLDPARLRKTIERLRATQGLPVDMDALLRTLKSLLDQRAPRESAAAAANHGRPRFVARDGERFVVIDIGKVSSIEADKNYVWFEFDGTRVRARYSINDVESSLDAEQFLRLNRSLIMRASEIAGFERNFRGKLLLTLRNGRRVACTAGYRERVLRYLGV
jgi:two-component system, LytTR family, response regulator